MIYDFDVYILLQLLEIVFFMFYYKNIIICNMLLKWHLNMVGRRTRIIVQLKNC